MMLGPIQSAMPEPVTLPGIQTAEVLLRKAISETSAVYRLTQTQHQGAEKMKMGKLEKMFVNSPGHSERVSNYADKFLTFVEVKPNQKYLDVGCGNGAAPTYLARKYHLNVTGIDVDPEQIQLAEANSRDVDNVRFLTIDGTQLPFEDNEFDIVSTFKTTHHIPNWPDALAEMLRVLKPNGYFIYADFVYPEWLAFIGRKLVKNKVGFPTVEELNLFIEENHLARVHWSKSLIHLMHCEFVLQKNGA
jgi:SAM-dependent methyltransferase